MVTTVRFYNLDPYKLDVEALLTPYTPIAQAVWNTTTKIGIASASDSKGAWYTVARYSPPGNFVGKKPYPST
jgi:hypothetical protein